MTPMLIAAMLLAADVDPKPPEVDGFVVFRICSLGKELPKGLADWIYVKADAIIVVSDPDDSPRGCVAITSTTGRRIYVYGTDSTVARILTEARKKFNDD